MSNIKKIIGVVLALVMVLSVATIAFAADGDAYSIAITADKTTLNPGESATVTVKLTTNYYASAISIPVFFDKSQVTVSAGTSTVQDATIATEDSASIQPIYDGAGLSKDDYAVRALVLVPEWGAALKKYSNEAVMTFTVKANEGATGTAVFECVSSSIKIAPTHANGSLYVGKNSSGTAKYDSLAETVNTCDITAAKATINFAGAAEAADLAVKSAYADSGIIIDKNKTLGGQYAGVVYGFTLDATVNAAFHTNRFEATNGGSIVLVKTPYQSRASYGTGATIQVKNADGTLSKTYVIIIFGDVNGDGRIQNNDALEIYNVAYKVTSALTDKVKILAGNAAAASGANDRAKERSLYTINAQDALAIYDAAVAKTYDQVTQASSHALYSSNYQ